ncbi:MAG: ribonuclease HII [Patescibacteria group bacterium]
MHPSLKEEKKLWKQGFDFVVGLDESGRGPLAGPVTAAAVCVNLRFRIYDLRFKVKDSKKLNEGQREFFYKELTSHKNIEWGVGAASERVIDKINILEATKLAMQKAVDNLCQKTRARELFDRGCFLLLDGNFKIKSKIPQRSIVAADERVFSCVAAGIIAKVTRDRIMIKMHKKYPGYGFDKHKGYGTKIHIENLQNFGPCKIHRKSFFPVYALAKMGNT